ncbi:TlpA family protein disulfide reductase [Bacillus sp. SCS-153A]|uniref:TlpA family protein disulfide reductase n=1 Tax=Rossellomorea sedimentorum TaxID=3115294 RepID=UPI003905796F
MKKLIGILLLISFVLVIYMENTSLNVLYYFDGQRETTISRAVESPSTTEGELPDRLPGPKIGTLAPDFTLPTLSGDSVSLDDFKGKKVLINFWAAWCTPCTQELPALEAFNKANDEIEVISINIDPEDHAEEFARETGITFPVLLDKDDKVNDDYQVISIPTTMLIDEKGYMINKHIGALDEEGFHVFVQ